MQRPMRDLLTRASRRMSLHMPGGQGRAPFERWDPYRLDTTELSVTDDLYRPTGAIAEAQRLAAQSAKAASALLLHGGSTAGIHAMLLYAAHRGDTVIFPRNVHLSCLNLCATAGLNPVFAEPSFTAEGRVYTPSAAYGRAMDEHPEAKAVLTLHGDYYGLLTDVRTVASAAHARGKLVLCDEAHGAYFNRRGDVPNAGECGADLFVQSAHKTLPALTAGAWLFARDGIDADRLRATLRLVQTSSPSFANMLSLDDARAWMDAHGRERCEALLAAMERFRTDAAKLGFADDQLEPPEGLAYDRLRLVLKAPMGGDVLDERLQARGIDVEMCDAEHIVCIVSLMDGEKRLRRLLKALRSIAAEHLPNAVSAAIPAYRPERWPERRLSPTDAVFAEQEPVAAENAAGRISAAHVGLYPPGVAWLTAGDEITPELAALLAKTPKERLFGLTEDGRLRCVRG